MTDYYSHHLAGRRLKRVYDIAPPRVQQYLDCEIEHVLSYAGPDHDVLELGCGYGRVAIRLAAQARRVVGIDVAEGSLRLARELGGSCANCEFYCMDALRLGFPDDSFDLVVCVQNGISAFRVDPKALIDRKSVV